jgi:hypothetical protein
VNWISVISTVFASAAYNEDKRQLYLKFHSGRVYRYFEFPPYQYDEFLAAESQGRYFGAHIRGKFRDEKVREAHDMAGGPIPRGNTITPESGEQRAVDLHPPGRPRIG